MYRLITILIVIAISPWMDYSPLGAQSVRQSRPLRFRPTETYQQQVESPRSVFESIESGIRSDEITTFTSHLANQVYLSLRGIESGYYSSTQASYILRNFFSSRRTVRFKFSTVSDAESTPFATGGGTFSKRGTMEILQVYVAVALTRGHWAITQFNVY